MRVSVIFALVAFLAISVVTAFPSANSNSDQGSSNNQSTLVHSDGQNGEESVLSF